MSLKPPGLAPSRSVGWIYIAVRAPPLGQQELCQPIRLSCFSHHQLQQSPASASGCDYKLLLLSAASTFSCRNVLLPTSASALCVAYGWPFYHQRCNTPGPQLRYTAAGATKSSTTTYSCSSPTTTNCKSLDASCLPSPSNYSVPTFVRPADDNARSHRLQLVS